MPDYSKYDIPSPDGYYSPIVECRACTKTFLDEEMTVKELLEKIDQHEKECEPKTWLYYIGYKQENAFDSSVVHVRWYDGVPLTEVEKVRQEERASKFTHGVLVKFERRTW